MDYSKFSKAQLAVIKDAEQQVNVVYETENVVLNLSPLYNPEFTSWQMLEISRAILNRVDLTDIADVKYDAEQMKVLFDYRMFGSNVALAMDPEYNEYQMAKLLEKHSEVLCDEENKDLGKEELEMLIAYKDAGLV